MVKTLDCEWQLQSQSPTLSTTGSTCSRKTDDFAHCFSGDVLGWTFTIYYPLHSYKMYNVTLDDMNCRHKVCTFNQAIALCLCILHYKCIMSIITCTYIIKNTIAYLYWYIYYNIKKKIIDWHIYTTTGIYIVVVYIYQSIIFV